MNLQELYSLTIGQKITKPFIHEKYYPLPFSDYITFQPWSKPVKNYDHWIEVLSLLNPILEKNNIKIIQLGAANEIALPFCYHTQGTTNFGQMAYLIKNSKLHFGSDSVGQHIAGHYNIPLIDLIVNNYKNVVQPYFGDKNRQIILEPNRPNGHKPNFILDGENPKLINTITPESIVSAICKLLNLEFSYPYKTLQVGSLYNNKFIESFCDGVINTQQFGLQNLIMRCDYNLNEPVIFEQAKYCKLTLITDKIINPELLQAIRPQITEMIFNIKNNPPVDYFKIVNQLKIPLRLISYLPEEEINKFKLDILDLNLIINKFFVKIPSGFDFNNASKFWVKSNKFLLGRGKIYQGLYFYNQDLPVQDFNPIPQQILNNGKLEKELFINSDYNYYLENI